MSMPSFPNIDPPIQREDAVNQILSSIAMEELGLSHILNAEGEKLQYILGTIPGLSGQRRAVCQRERPQHAGDCRSEPALPQIEDAGCADGLSHAGTHWAHRPYRPHGPCRRNRC